MSEFLMEWDGDGEPFCQLRHRSPAATVAKSVEHLIQLCNESTDSIVLVVSVWSAIDWQQAEEALTLAKRMPGTPRLIVFFCNECEGISRALHLGNPYQFPVWCRARDGKISFRFRGAITTEQMMSFFGPQD